MKNSYIILIVVLVVALALFFGFKSKNLEAPAEVGTENNIDNSAAGGTQLTESERPDGEGDTLDTDLGVEVSVGAVKEFTIEGKNFSFTPNMITVKKGDKVKITFKNSAGFHDFVIDEYGVATKQAQAPDTEVLEFTANKAGTFEYYCSVGSHRAMGMFGTLKVE